MNTKESFFEVLSFRLKSEKVFRLDGTQSDCEATVKIKIGKIIEHRVSGGEGPVNALDLALRKALEHHYPEVKLAQFEHYELEVLNGDTDAFVKVTISFTNGESTWCGIGTSHNIVEASFDALVQGFHKGISRMSPALS